MMVAVVAAAQAVMKVWLRVQFDSLAQKFEIVTVGLYAQVQLWMVVEGDVVVHLMTRAVK